MRRRVVIAIGLLCLVAAGGSLAVRAGSPAETPVALPTEQVPELQAISVQAGTAEAVQALTLTGVVRDPAGQPVAGATVRLAASAQPTMATHVCAHCDQPLLSCRARQSWATVEAFLAGGKSGLPFGAETTTDDKGQFRFERLKGVSFTVWATKEGLGLGVKERAAPGEPVELYLPDVRTLVGEVRDEAGDPVPGATVRAISQRIPVVVTGQSGADGKFALTSLGMGPFYVHASAPKLLPAARQQVDASGDPVTLTLLTPRRLEVTLVKDGKPHDGEVSLTADHVLRTQATEGGKLAFEALYPGAVVATARAGALSSTPHTVSLDAAVTRVTLTLDAGGKILATAVDDSGEPVKDPVFELVTRSGGPIARKAGKTGEVVTFGPLGEGQYELRATAYLHQPAAMPVKLAGAEVGVEVVLSRGLAIRGKVLDEYGRPAAGVAVLVTPIGDSVIADAEGRFTAPVPTAGLYELHAHHSDWGGGQLKVQAPADDVELHLEPRAGVEITVSSGGRRVEGAGVVLFLEREGTFRNDRASSGDGVVLMRGLPPATYTLIASHPDFLPSDRQQVVLEDGKLLKVSAELKAGGEIKGVVVDTLGAPISGAAVHPTPRASEPAITDGQGRFSLKPLRKGGTYALRVAQRGYEQQERTTAKVDGPEVRIVVNRLPVFRGRVVSDGKPVKNFRVDDQFVDSADGRFELALPATEDRVIFSVTSPGYEAMVVDRPNSPDLGDLELERAEAITGVVTDENGQRVADAVVGCDVCEQSVTSAPDGRFTMAGPSFVKEFVITARKGKRSALRNVAAGVSYVELQLSPAVKLSGTVWLADGRVGAGVEIQGAHAESSDAMSAVTGPDGKYSAEVSRGAWRFQVHRPGAGVSEQQTVLIAGLQAADERLDFGPSPGTASMRVALKPQRGWGLWLVQGGVEGLASPPLELLKAKSAQLIFQPTVNVVTFQGLTPGAYTLVWGSLHEANPPVVMRVQVPQQPEVSLLH
jgi:Carboxypeptidase regulatory-like domain